jgi:hypothetical protein
MTVRFRGRVWADPDDAERLARQVRRAAEVARRDPRCWALAASAQNGAAYRAGYNPVVLALIALFGHYGKF